ncbi:hypothetical protein MesoLj113a_44920 [Mesorhizobium sp. 113-1-2]|nr:Uncharacterized protein MLTONO_0518 [Mesorhizobium loti]BCG73334.1 hypothetical protein MesoLj113a_44920 [Mesorhizobium sp. 113-1-2]
MLLFLLVAPNVIWIVADTALIARKYGFSPAWWATLFDFLQLPFSESFVSLGFVLQVLIPGMVAVVCYKVDETAKPMVVTEDLSEVGYSALLLCLFGAVLGFVSLATLSVAADSVTIINAKATPTAIRGLAAATLAFYGFYAQQLMGFSPK